MNYILYHRDQDGFGAALAAWRQFSLSGEETEYISVQYDEPMPEMKDNSNVYILDFSYSPDEVMELSKRMTFVKITDHHKTSAEAFSEIVLPTNVVINIDQSRAGCALAWEQFNYGQEIPELLLDIEDRDLWKFERKNTKEIFVYLSVRSWDFNEWHELCSSYCKYREAVGAGKTLLLMQESIIKQIARNSHKLDMDGYNTVAVNSPIYQSEVAEYILKKNSDCDVAIVYADIVDKKTKELKRLHSLRSRGDVDVSEIAKKRGGGGHKAAAGYIEKV